MSYVYPPSSHSLKSPVCYFQKTKVNSKLKTWPRFAETYLTSLIHYKNTKIQYANSLADSICCAYFPSRSHIQPFLSLLLFLGHETWINWIFWYTQKSISEIYFVRGISLGIFKVLWFECLILSWIIMWFKKCAIYKSHIIALPGWVQSRAITTSGNSFSWFTQQCSQSNIRICQKKSDHASNLIGTLLHVLVWPL